jgi:hypothetical protein
MKFLLNITTTKGSNWRDKIREAKEMEVEEIAVFPTVLDKEERKKLYDLLSTTKIKRIPLVHLRDDMDVKELDFFVKKYDTRVFNTHSERQFPIDKNWILNYKEFICIENNYDYPLDGEEVKKYGGICLDFAHLENIRILKPERYEKEVEVLNSYPIKCNHISAIKKEFSFVDSKTRTLQYDSHHLDSLSELDYLRNYPVRYFSDFCAIELDNSLQEQAAAIEYISKFMEDRDKFINKMIGH